MTERQSVIVKNAQFVSNINHELIAPELTTQEFLSKWHSLQRSEGLNWFNARRASSPVASLTFHYSVRPEQASELQILVPSIPSEYVSRQIPLAIGIGHCTRPPLHGGIVIETLDKSVLERTDVRNLLDNLEITAPEMIPEEYHLAQEVTAPSDLRPSSLEILQGDVQQDVLILLGISPSQRNLVYLDPEVGKLVDATVYALIKSNTIFKDNYPYPSISRYHQKLQDAKQAPYEHGDYPWAQVRYMKRWLFHMLTGERKHKLSKAEFHKRLLNLYTEDHGEEMFASLPPIKASVRLSTTTSAYRTDQVMTFLEFQQKIAHLVPDFPMKMIDPSAQVLNDIKGVHNIIITTEDGLRVGFFLSRSSGECKIHKKPRGDIV